jgi:hypothetical protein
MKFEDKYRIECDKLGKWTYLNKLNNEGGKMGGGEFSRMIKLN